MSYPRYPKYKPSGVEWLGGIPEHWRCMRLKDVATHNDEVLDEATEPQCELVYVDISSVDGQAGITRREYLRFANAPSRARRRVRHGDVIVSTVRTYLRAITCIRNPERNLIVSTGFVVVRPRTSLHSEYLGYLLTAGFFIEGVIARSVGVSYPAINASEVMAITVPVPPLQEQEAIATLLAEKSTQITSLIAEQERLIELLKEKRQAVISHAVTKGLNPNAPMKPSGIEWLGDIPAHWSVIPVRHVLTRIEQGWSPECESRPAGDEEWGVLRAGCVNRGVFNEDDNKALPPGLTPLSELEVFPGDVLMSRASGSPELVGSVARVETTRPRLMLSDKVFRLTVAPSMASAFFVTAANSSLFRHQVERSISGADGLANNLPQSALRRFVVPLPPLTEQLAVTERVEDATAAIGALIAEAERAIALLQERRSALISAAVTGQIDVRNAAEHAVA